MLLVCIGFGFSDTVIQYSVVQNSVLKPFMLEHASNLQASHEETSVPT